MSFQSLDDRIKSKMRSDDRILVLEQIPGEQTRNALGLVDNRLFKGGNALHAVRDPGSYLWSLKYEAGGLPPVFKQNFTSFTKLLDFVTKYYAKRGIRIKEIIDKHD